ncbi:MAG: hypothetical protein LUG16_04360 [Candidatus Gastranaerophilales bacterium]|nr:hypothetical protein [Candidatus Gastranaerophilales bacterium]
MAEIEYKQAESLICPSEIDNTSSQDGIFIRRNIEKVETETGYKYTYQEAFINKNEYETYSKNLLVNQIKGEDNTAEYEKFKTKLDTGIPYTNGKYYKPKWIDLYSEIIDSFAVKIMLYEKAGGDISSILALTTPVYDVTGLAENAETMSVTEIIDLWLYLYSVKEQYYAEYKASL